MTGLLWASLHDGHGTSRATPEEHDMELRDLLAQFCFRAPHFRVLLNQRANRPVRKLGEIPCLDQRVAYPACSPVADALPGDSSDHIGEKALRRVAPNNSR